MKTLQSKYITLFDQKVICSTDCKLISSSVAKDFN